VKTGFSERVNQELPITHASVDRVEAIWIANNYFSLPNSITSNFFYSSRVQLFYSRAVIGCGSLAMDGTLESPGQANKPGISFTTVPELYDELDDALSFGF